MKLEFPKIDVQTSRDFENESFGLGDVRVIMELLSSKIYARPKRIIVQEVASNARDANREAGRANTPIQIKLPSRLDDNLIIADSGPGISPSRMSEVFLKYGNSTKRNDNVLTGGFGIGAKTPFTYTDTFNVLTITDDDDGVRRRRIYIAHKASNGFAKMSLISTEKSSDETGTAISFAVDKKDFQDFENAVRRVCKYWDVRPIVTGIPNWEWPKESILEKGSGWVISNSYSDPMVIIDGIPYSLRLEEVFANRSTDVYRVVTHGAIRMYFNTGEIDVSATREDLDYSDKTIQCIKSRAALALKELQSKVDAQVSSAKSRWDASVQWHAKDKYADLVVQPKWRGQELLNKAYSIPHSRSTKNLKGYTGSEDYITLSEHIKITNFVYDKMTGSITSYKRWTSIDRNLYISDRHIVVEDDEKKSRPNRLRLQTIFDKHPNAQFVTIILLKTEVGRLWANQFLHLEEIPHTQLSSWPKKAKPKGPNGKPRTVNAVKRLEHSSARRGWSKQWVGCASLSPEDGQNNYYILIKNGKPISPDGEILSKESVERIFQTAGITKDIYGILYKYRNKIDDTTWTSVWTKALDKLNELKAKPEVSTYIEWGTTESYGGMGAKVARTLSSNDSVLDISLKDFFQKSELAVKSGPAWRSYVELARIMREPIPPTKGKFKSLKGEVVKKYPLLPRYQNMFGYWNTTNEDSTIINELIFYVNAKFKASEETNANA